MADHEFFGTVSVSEAATDADHVLRKGEADTALSGKADTAHSHVVGDVTGLQTALDGKATTSHGHVITDVTGLQTALAGKADTTHGHTADDVSGLQTVIDGRIDTLLEREGAADALDTLRELSEALGGDENFAATVNNMIGTLDGRVDALEAVAGTGIYKANVGDGSLSLFTVTHGLGTVDVNVIVRRVSDGQRVYPVDKAPTADTVTVDFGSTVPASNSYRVIVDAK